MKKVLILCVMFACFSFTTSKVNSKTNKNTEIINNFNIEKTKSLSEYMVSCGPNASAISSSCFSGCVSVVPVLTGVLEVDVARINEGPRKPTLAEYNLAKEFLDDFCNS